jgi:hypothetical protein
VRELERKRVTVQQAASRLGITESAVRKRVRKGDLRSEKVLEGNRERVYVFLDPDAAPFPEPFREKYMRSLEDRVKTLEDEVMRQQAIILSMSQSLRALTGAPQAPQGVEEAQEDREPRPSTGGTEPEPTRPPAAPAPTSRLGMSAWALAVGAIATLLTWLLVLWSVYLSGVDTAASLVPPVLAGLAPPLLSGLWAGSTKRPSLPWFSSPLRWLRRGERSVLEIATFAAGVPAAVAAGGAFAVFYVYPPTYFRAGQLPILVVVTFAALAAIATLAFMSGAFLGNALQRVGLLGTPKELLQDEEEEVWSPRKGARWGLATGILAALISGVFSVVAAALSR